MSDVELLQNSINELNEENTKLKTALHNLYNLISYDICQYFYRTNSIKKTTAQFYFNNVKECYYLLVDFNDDEYVVNKATDFKECYNEIFDNKTSP